MTDDEKQREQFDADRYFEGTELADRHNAALADAPKPQGAPMEALSFKMLVDAPISRAHQKYRTEGWINEGLEAHLADCRECRKTLAQDLRDFADQIELTGVKIAHRGNGRTEPG